MLLSDAPAVAADAPASAAAASQESSKTAPGDRVLRHLARCRRNPASLERIVQALLDPAWLAYAAAREALDCNRVCTCADAQRLLHIHLDVPRTALLAAERSVRSWRLSNLVLPSAESEAC